MYLINHVDFSGDNCTFHLVETGHAILLSNAGEYGNNGNIYKWRNPYQGNEDDRFRLIGDGNYTVDDPAQLVRSITAFVILIRSNNNSQYAIERINLDLFEIADD